jgi:(p)ppGpp synthase/HD superfamily hydrolase
MRVGSYLFLHGYSEEICVAGLLHDVLEDTPISEENIGMIFGEWVL